MLSKTSVGPTVQAGFDYRTANHWFIRVDVKWAQLRADVKLAKVTVDPVLSGIGIGYRW